MPYFWTEPVRNSSGSVPPTRYPPAVTSLSFENRTWSIRQAPVGVIRGLVSELQLHPLVAQCLALRVTTAEDARRWLRPSLSHLHDPYEIDGMARAVDRIKTAVSNQHRIRIVTDYDVDGTTSSLVLQGALRLIGGGDLVDYHIPDRFNEGYGFSEAAARQAIEDGIELIVTADIGVRDHAAVSLAASQGIDVIICDHHLPAGERVPDDALAVLCPPKEGCSYPNKALAAVGVSLKMAQALLENHPRREAITRSMLKVAAIGTVADVVDLSTPENRAIVAFGIQGLRAGRHAPGLHALLEVSGVQGEVTAEDLGFRLGPRINAAGRLKQATAVIELFDERDPDLARAKAQQLDALNGQRQQIQRRLVDEVVANLGDPPPPFVVEWGEEEDGWHRGVVGIVAAKVRDHAHRPAAIIAVSGSEARGSIRSIPGAHAVEALDSVAEMLTAYGGHPAAAGFSLPANRLDSLRAGLCAWAEAHQADVSPAASLSVDARCDADDFRSPEVAILAQALQDLGPHGKGNPAPLIQVDGVQVTDVQPMGERHIRMRINGVDAVWWGGRRHTHALTQGQVSVVGQLGYNHWRGRRTVRFTVEDARSAPVPSPEASRPDP